MSTRLYVGNLPKEYTNDELNALFANSKNAENADVQFSAKLVLDRKNNNKSRGFAFVTIEKDEDVEKFIADYNGKSVNGTSIKVEKAQPSAKKENASSGSRNGGARRNGKASSGSGLRSVTSTPASTQPDPRWAKQLAELKQQLEAQTTNS